MNQNENEVSKITKEEKKENEKNENSEKINEGENNDNSKEIQENNIDNNIESELKENIRYSEEDEKKKENENNEEKKEETEDLSDMLKPKTDKKKIRKLPKIAHLFKSLTEGALNNLTTTNTSENHFSRENSESAIVKNQLEEFHKPKIRNKFYLQTKSIGTSFHRKKLKLALEKKIILNELTEEDKLIKKMQEIRGNKPLIMNKKERQKYLQLYNCNEIEENVRDLKGADMKKRDYKCEDFNITRYNEPQAFNVFYQKMKRDTEIFRKGGENMNTPSFNLIRAINKNRAIPRPIGVVKKKGDLHKMELDNKLVGDNYVKCICESLKVSDHITEINLRKNRLSDISIIPLFKTIIKNKILLKQLVFIDLSYNRISIAATELICKYIMEYNCC
jgi:hypothetical protein